VVDLIGSVDGDRVPTAVNVGAVWHPHRKLTVAADYNDLFFNVGENMFNKLYLGAEYRPLPILPLRAGFGQGWPSVGGGLDFKVVQLDVSIYGIEHSTHPGGDGDYNYAVRLRAGF
jgi:hypothetical protein